MVLHVAGLVVFEAGVRRRLSRSFSFFRLPSSASAHSPLPCRRRRWRSGASSRGVVGRFGHVQVIHRQAPEEGVEGDGDG